ncbi:hypothetical protein pdam_00025937 [Pocillopora damicornis]|uniref:Uncharacterized protein n=1 Tax=Pocillopora damicornis TaxID=46731 RepID=A0A3M6U7C3_POCDA|nr:hypothetical protein pdam_00025937 [Pocillopora damicornis]
MISKSLKQKSRVLNDVLQNVQERFGYLENDPYWIQTSSQKMTWSCPHMARKKCKCWQISTKIIC